MANAHGGQALAFAQSHQLAISDILDFSASINPNTPTIDWEQLAQQAQLQLSHYPQEYNAESDSRLKPLLAQTFSLDESDIYLSSGISQAIWQLFRALRPQHTLLFTPIYSEYQRCAQAFSQNTLEISLRPQTWMQTNDIPEHSIIVLVNPCTPQGVFQSPHALRQLLAAAHTQNALCLIDESFLPFVSLDPSDSVRQWLNQYPNLIVLQSLTKFYACAGVRIGALFSKTHLTPWLPQTWTLSTLDRLWLEQALTDTEHSLKTQQWLRYEKPKFIKALQSITLIKQLYPSDANFILVEFILPSADIQAALVPHAILIRDAQSFGYSANHARIAIKSPTDNQRLILALQHIEGENA